MNNREIGTIYEKIAVDYLLHKNYVILEQSYRVKVGEIDIIAKSPEGIIVYVEVKYRSNNRYGSALEAVNLRKQHQICRVAAYHFAKMKYPDSTICRFDVIGIDGMGRISHIENAFTFS